MRPIHPFLQRRSQKPILGEEAVFHNSWSFSWRDVLISSLLCGGDGWGPAGPETPSYLCARSVFKSLAVSAIARRPPCGKALLATVSLRLQSTDLGTKQLPGKKACFHLLECQSIKKPGAEIRGCNIALRPAGANSSSFTPGASCACARWVRHWVGWVRHASRAWVGWVRHASRPWVRWVRHAARPWVRWVRHWVRYAARPWVLWVRHASRTRPRWVTHASRSWVCWVRHALRLWVHWVRYASRPWVCWVRGPSFM